MGHGHAHEHDRRARTSAFAIGLGLNLVFVAVELVAGVAAQSVALVADAAHNLGDVLGLGIAWAAAWLALRKPSPRRTYGLRRSTILAALGNAILLLVTVGAIGWEALRRLRTGEVEAQGKIMLVVAAIGVVVNAGSAALFAKDREHDVNVRGAFLHLVGDAAVSLGVVVAGGVLLATRWLWVDPAASLVVSAVILWSTWKLLREALDLALDAVPEHVDVDEVRRFLETLPDVCEVHDLHIWAMSTTETALTAHLVMRTTPCSPGFLRDAARRLEERYAIHHATIQLEEPAGTAPCAQASDDVV